MKDVFSAALAFEAAKLASGGCSKVRTAKQEEDEKGSGIAVK